MSGLYTDPPGWAADPPADPATPSGVAPDTEDSPPEWQYHGARRGSFPIALFLLLSLIVCVTGAVAVPGGLGILVGYQQLQVENHENAIQHFQRGLGYLAENYPELAYTEFENALSYDSAYEPAQQKLRELQAKLGGRGTPGPGQESLVASTLFDEAVNLISQKQWSDAINRLEQLKSLKADYRAQEVSDFLYQAYVEGGKEAAAAGQIELARERFDAALAIRGTSAEVQRQRDLAVLYLDGQQAVGYDWPTAIQKFSGLYQQDPNYDDVKKRLVDAYIQYGDLAARQNAWCLAQREYESALAITADATLSQKRGQASTLCRQAILATPTMATTGTENYIWKISKATAPPCEGNGDVSGFVRDALGRPIPGVSVAYEVEGLPRVTTRTDAYGQYKFIWGKDAGLFHVVVLGADGKTPAGIAANIQYPGGTNSGCHVIVDWHKVQ